MLSLPPTLFSITTKLFVYEKMSITTSEVALKLGTLSALGWFIGINRDPTNYIELRVATAGTKFAKLSAGEVALFKFGSGVTAPYAIANTGACQMEYLLLNT